MLAQVPRYAVSHGQPLPDAALRAPSSSVKLGAFSTPEEAALAVARYEKQQTAALDSSAPQLAQVRRPEH